MDNFFSGKEAQVDSLTNLYSREVVLEYMQSLIDETTPFTLALLDIDNFKYINDTYGHLAGDKILCEIAERIKKQLGDDGSVARFGGDEFLIVLKDLVEYDKLWNICHKILVNMGEVEITDFPGLYVTVTIGLARYPENEKNLEKIMEMADKALYRGKTKGRNCFIIYLPEKHANIVLKKEVEKKLSPMYLHSVVFNYLSQSKDLKVGINNILDFFCSYFMIDHVCIQTEKQLLFEKIHTLSKNRKFEKIPNHLIESKINKTLDLFYLNDIKQLFQANQMELYEALKKQQIMSTCYANISYRGKSFGFIRVDMTGLGFVNSFRIWQQDEMAVFMSAAKMIATILYHTGEEL